MVPQPRKLAAVRVSSCCEERPHPHKLLSRRIPYPRGQVLVSASSTERFVYVHAHVVRKCAGRRVRVCAVCAKTYTYNIYTFCNRARTSIGIAPHRRLHEYVTWRRIFIAQDNANRLRPLVLADYSFMSAWCCCIALFGRCFVHTLTHVGALTYHKSLGGWHTLSAPPACYSRAAGVNAYAYMYTHTCIHASSTPISRASSSHTCAYL